MKKTTILLTIVVTALFTNKVSAQPGSLDPEFGTDGIVMTDLGANETGRSVVIQPDGKIVVASETGSGPSNYDFVVVRYNTDGTPDNSFGTGGVAITDFGALTALAQDVALQSDGKIIIAGYALDNVTYEGVFALARYNADGSPDNTFRGGGKLTASINNYERANALVVQNDGKIVIAGTTFGTTNDFALMRFNSDGTTDNTFGTAGIVTTSFGGFQNEAFAVSIHPNGKIIASGYTYKNFNDDFALACYNPDGSLDNTFGTGGIVITDFGTEGDISYTMDILPNGKIVLAGSCDFGTAGSSFALAQYNPDGSLDNNFGTNGKVVTDINPDINEIHTIVHQSDGRLVAAGRSDNGFNSGYILVRYLPDGSLDSGFGADGIVITTIGTGFNYANSVAIQSDGKIVATGEAPNASSSDIAVLRYLGNPTIMDIADHHLSQESLRIYPNPVDRDATLEYVLKANDQISIRLVDIQGRTLKTFVDHEMQESGKHQQDIFLPEGLIDGYYLLTISSPRGRMSIKIVK
jgi:uncharacterized delta-60 repeat protein